MSLKMMLKNEVSNGDSTMKKKRSIMVKTSIVLFLLFALSLLLLFFNFVFPQTKLYYSLSTLTSFAVTTQETKHFKTKIGCNRSHSQYDICFINGSTILDSNTSTFHAVGPTQPKHFMEKIRPYPRKWEPHIMTLTKEVTLRAGPTSPQTCDVVHNATAIVFSAGGFIGHVFHDFNEAFIPLFVTVRSMSLSDRDVVLVIGKVEDWWVSKYAHLLGEFSKHPILKLDDDTSTHCFNSAIVGLIYHGLWTINPNLMPSPITLVHFHNLLVKVYNQAHQPIHQRPTARPRPKLVLLARNGRVGRVLLNQDQVRGLAEEVGFDVVVLEPKGNTPMSNIFGLVNRSHVVVGVHGAAMSHILFLRSGSVLIQVVPIALDSVSESCYEKPAKAMGLEYMEYKISVEESSLVKKYKRSSPILRDASRLHERMWPFVKVIYMKHQNVTLDLTTFRGYLEMAYNKAKIFMERNG